MRRSTLTEIYYRSFTKAALTAYIGGTVAHILRLVFEFPLSEAPSWTHWVITIIAGYASIGLVLFAGKLKISGPIDRILYGTVIVHLGGSTLLHLYSLVMSTNNWMAVFPLRFSYFALVYFVGLGLYCNHLDKRVGAQRSVPLSL
ncbi:MAG: hypothetical protein OEV30_09020 [Ignavibacteria bacterium]|nr:hypothetical protein [Ignavibacteria bacterium]